MKRLFLLVGTAALSCAIQLYAENYIVIGKDSKVFESPMARDEFAAVNKDDIPIVLKAGMAFKANEQKAGWYVVEYSPGIRGMVMQSVIAPASAVKTPMAGTYKVANNSAEEVTVSGSGDSWSLKSGGVSLSGFKDGDIVVFADNSGNIKYTFLNYNGKPTVFNYDNTVTNYF